MRYSARQSLPLNPVRLSYLRREQSDGTGYPAAMGAFSPPASPDEFGLLAEWDRPVKSLLFHAESLISWAPVEIVSRPDRVVDETGKQWFVCRFRYFGPVVERDQIVASVKCALLRLTHWEEVETIDFSDQPLR
ncbi:MAG: hypothetical protein WA989_06840 [Henriciella sp.]|uniref:hypothetical protein n=1 Tax=Henriciella sp. TaxID=1968823 RepID=UPI003C76F20D